MDLNKNELESLKIINYYSEQQGYVGLSILERKLFNLIGFEQALQDNIKVVDITARLCDMGLIKRQGLSNVITDVGRAFIQTYEGS